MTAESESFQLSSGVTVVFESMPHTESAAISVLLPAGVVREAAGRNGTSSILTEMLPRGAAGMSSRELCAALDNLGLQRHLSNSSAHLTFSGATTADRLLHAVPLIANMIRSPHLEETDFLASRDLVAQSLMSVEDEPRQQLSRMLRKCAYPAPWGNPSDGEAEDLPAITLDGIRDHHQRFVTPRETIIGIAGNLELTAVRDALERAFGDWSGEDLPEVICGDVVPSPCHVHHKSAQTQIGVAWHSVPVSSPRYYDAWAAVSLLSGGMSSRLFTEVREKRGLCYAISASLSCLKDEARVMACAGTTPERAQETLDVMVAEILRLHEDITEEELQRCRARARSSLIMQQESTSSRASSLARDMYLLNRIVSLDQIHEHIRNVTLDSVREFILDHPPQDMALVTIGPAALDPATTRQAAS